MDLHAAYGGVVPEIAARSHIEAITPVINQALQQACPCKNKNDERSDLSKKDGDMCDHWGQIDGIAVTYGAGLGGSLLVGVMAARTYAITKNKPLYAVNHVEGHIYANFLTDSLQGGSLQTYALRSRQPKFPMLGLIISGGHSQIVIWQGHFDYTLLGQTVDDAIGEAFDKVAKLLGLPYPGGPHIGQKAKAGDPFKYDLPKAKLKDPYNYSFSGLKTAVLRLAQAEIGKDHRFPSFQIAEKLSETQKANIAASFQRVALETVVDKVVTAYEEFQPKSVVIGGGVAASPELRRQLAERLPRLSDQQNGQAFPIEYQDAKLMTDNGAMIATLGCFQALYDKAPVDPYSLEIAPNLAMSS